MTEALTEPVPLQDFISDNLIGQKDDLIFKTAGLDQACFVRDKIHWLFAQGPDGDARYQWKKRHPVRVISTHRSKSVVLPVYEIAVPDEVVVVMRGNFYDWKVSVTSERSYPDLFHDLIRRDQEISAVYCEGFKTEWVHGSFNNDRRSYTVEIPTEQMLWTFCWLLTLALGLR